MIDLSHWDFAERFSGYEAAALILGVEPRESQDEEMRIRVVCSRMEIHYIAARDNALARYFGDPLRAIRTHEGAVNIELVSVELSRLIHLSIEFDDDQSFSIWMNNRYANKFDRQEFSRSSIDQWVKAIGMTSVYSFDRSTPKPHSAVADVWPWGTHTTVALGHLEAAARRYWVNYDPANPSSANTNATVSEWLQTDRKVSKTMADAIASMLRPDGLPTGPRR